MRSILFKQLQRQINQTRQPLAILYKLLISAFIAAALLSVSSCRKDECKDTMRYTIYTPVFASAAEVRARFKSEAPRPIEAAGKIYLYGNYIFLNELNEGIHIIDNSNPEAPDNFAFINIPGNVDMAVKGHVLYADSYMDLLAIDISDPHQVKELKRLKDVYPQRVYEYFRATSDSIVIDYLTRDTVVEIPCHRDLLFGGQFNSPGVFALSSSSDGGNKSGAMAALGKGGSMARFALLNDYLYTVDYSRLNIFGIQNPASPEKQDELYLFDVVETIFPYRGNLFIGSQSGMYIYSLQNPAHPVRKGAFGHIRSCDPVVAEDSTAYVTLRGGSACGGFTNQLDVLNISDLSNPILIKSYPMSSPYGLGIDGEHLFVCEGSNGLKFLDASDPQNITSVAQVPVEAFDVIPHNKVLLVTAKDGLYQYDYSNLHAPRLLSKLVIN
ncbi:LVIVD repeat-containing protein [Chitinophaga agrisoli]|nr:hypothetical protein [Chitinophaga agrisoli]